MTTVELATSLAFSVKLKFYLLALEVLASQAFWHLRLRFSNLNKDHICQMYNINLFRFSIVNLSLPLQPSEALRYLTTVKFAK